MLEWGCLFNLKEDFYCFEKYTFKFVKIFK